MLFVDMATQQVICIRVMQQSLSADLCYIMLDKQQQEYPNFQQFTKVTDHRTRDHVHLSQTGPLRGHLC